MKKLLVTLLALLMCVSLAACSNKEEEVVPENPVKQYETLAEINEIAGVELVAPGVAGKTGEEYYIIDNKTAVYKFSLNGYEYFMRGCRDASIDMSGVFVDGKTLFAGHEDEIFDFEEGEGYKVGRFILGGRQYIFGVYDQETMDQNVFLDLCTEISNLIISNATSKETKAVTGSYQDSTSQRAVAYVTVSDIETLTIQIYWASSATEYDEWDMTGKLENGKINYSEVEHYYVVIDENGKTAQYPQGDFKPGYFEVKDNQLLWTGSGEEQSSTCVFEKVEAE